MKQNLILPLHGVRVEYKNGERLYYLAGINSDWQKEAITKLTILDPNCIIVCPFEDEDLLEMSIPGSEDGEGEIKYPSIMFLTKSAWKNYYMEQASFYGAIIFWLPYVELDDIVNPTIVRNICTTHRYLGRWILKSANPEEFSLDKEIHKGGRVSLVVGIEKGGFISTLGADVSLEDDYNRSFKVHETLQETLESAVRLAKRTCPFPSLLQD
jgi:hypothetical protein